MLIVNTDNFVQHDLITVDMLYFFNMLYNYMVTFVAIFILVAVFYYNVALSASEEGKDKV